MDAGAEGYLLTAMQNLGWCGSNGFGAEPISWAEIHAYAACTGDISEPWEYQALRDMSKAYIKGLSLEPGVVDPATEIEYTDLHIAPIVQLDNPDAAVVLAAQAKAESGLDD